MPSSSSSACFVVFWICFSMAAKPFNVCTSHWLTCSTPANLFSETFRRACMRGSRTPASRRLCEVPGLEPVPRLLPGREGEPAVPGRELAGTSSPSARSPLLTRMGLSSRYSKEVSREREGQSSSDCERTGLPSSSSSLRADMGLRAEMSSRFESPLPDRSRISTAGQQVTAFAGKAAMRFSAKLSSVSCAIVGSPCSSFAESWFPATSNVERLGKAAPPETPARKLKLRSRFPASRNSSRCPRPRNCSAEISETSLWLAERTSRAERPTRPSRDESSFFERCSSLSLVSLDRPRPILCNRFLSRLRYSRFFKCSRPSMALMRLSSRCRAARLEHGSKPWILVSWQP
mmetsp:Transcript_42998/g.93627  ORF Transcript_42998/g.93627 Transcript_42998/m.93627 type:complete len:347 (+) Transcript_42998:659-1699(+)